MYHGITAARLSRKRVGRKSSTSLSAGIYPRGYLLCRRELTERAVSRPVPPYSGAVGQGRARCGSVRLLYG